MVGAPRSHTAEDGQGDVELILETGEQPVHDAPSFAVQRGSGGWFARALLGAAATVVAIVMIRMSPSGPGDQTTEESVAPLPAASAEPDRSEDATANGEPLPWPDPPRDHDPYVLSSPGLGLPTIEDHGDRSLLYVNESGRPTLIDLATGFRTELTVAESRQADYFLVEFGRVVSDDDSTSEFDHAHPPAGARSLAVAVHRTSSSWRGFPGRTAPSAGPALCLDSGGCPQIRWRTGFFTDGHDRVSSLREGPPIEAIAGFFGSTEWSFDGRWLDLRTGGDRPDIRLPAPAADAVVWVIEQPNSEVESSATPRGRR